MRTRIVIFTLITAASAAFGATTAERYKFVRELGAQAPPGTMNDPGKIAVDASGNIFVADIGNNRIEKFDHTDKFLLQWGKLGNQNGEFWAPVAVAVDASGNVFVADVYNNRIQKFTNGGAFITAWGSAGSGAGEFQFPVDVAVDANGNVFVADNGNNRIQKFTNSGAFIRTWGGQGLGNGQFNGPGAVALDAKGNVFLGDLGNNRIQKFTNDGRFAGSWGSYGTGNGQFVDIQWMTVDDATGDVFVTDNDFNEVFPPLLLNRVQKFTNNGVYITSWGSPGMGDGQFGAVSGVAVDASGDVYVADGINVGQEDKSIQKFTASGTFIGKFGMPGVSGNSFLDPSAVAMDASGNVFVADAWDNRIQEFTNEGTFVTAWGCTGAGNGQFNLPYGVAVDASGNVFVADQFNYRIQKFTHDGVFISAWGSQGSGEGQFDAPIGVAVDRSGNLFVVENCVLSPANCRIQKFTNDGGFITTWGSAGSGNGQFNDPLGVAVDANGNVFVADTYNSRIQKFTNGGVYITEWGGAGAGPGQIQTPYGLGVDASGNVYVSDTGCEGCTTNGANNNIEKFTNDGRYITTFGGYGPNDGQFNNPFGIAVDSYGNVFVADQLNQRIQKFAPCEEGEPGCLDGVEAAAASDGLQPSARGLFPKAAWKTPIVGRP